MFDQITELLANSLDVPFAAITLIDESRVWFKSAFGLGRSEVPRQPGLCDATIEGEGVRHIEDATVHPAARNNPLVLAEGFRFYAAAPLTTPDGYRIGTLCALDAVPRSLTQNEFELLERMASLVMREILARSPSA